MVRVYSGWFSRTIKQAEALRKCWKKEICRCDAALYFAVDKEEVIKDCLPAGFVRIVRPLTISFLTLLTRGFVTGAVESWYREMMINQK